MALPFPDIDPVAITLGPVHIRWYAIAYLTGFILGWRYCFALARKNLFGLTERHFDDFLSWAVIGTIIGGRLGYVMLYNGDEYFANPLEILMIWHGGMSFHGGMLGVIGAAWMYTRKYNLNFFAFTDVLACVTPIGLFFGRLANFVNGELFGRPTDAPWGVIFPHSDGQPRHPSQLYEAGAEGLLLLAIMFFLSRVPRFRARPGLLSGAFLFFYGIFRLGIEFFREPDMQLGYFFGGVTMGQMLCVPMILYGLYALLYSERRTKSRAV